MKILSLGRPRDRILISFLDFLMVPPHPHQIWIHTYYVFIYLYTVFLPPPHQWHPPHTTPPLQTLHRIKYYQIVLWEFILYSCGHIVTNPLHSVFVRCPIIKIIKVGRFLWATRYIYIYTYSIWIVFYTNIARSFTWKDPFYVASNADTWENRKWPWARFKCIFITCVTFWQVSLSSQGPL